MRQIKNTVKNVEVPGKQQATRAAQNIAFGGNKRKPTKIL